MPFGNVAEPTIVYRFGAKKPTTGAAEVWSQLHLAHEYKKKLIEIERGRREAVAAKVLELSPDLQRLDVEHSEARQRIEELRTTIKATRQKERKRVKPPADLKAALEEAIKTRKGIYARFKEARTQAYGTPEAKGALKEINSAALAETKKARAACGVCSGTYMQVEQAVDKARKGKMMPRFPRWPGGGLLAIRSRDAKVSKLFAKSDTSTYHLRMIPGGSKRRALIRFCVTPRKASPVWCEVPFYYDRPIPEDCKITWIFLTAERVGCTVLWHVHFVLARKSGWLKPDLAHSGEVGVDVGWRLRPDGSLRVAMWVGSDGRTGELTLPKELLGAWVKADELRALRDDKFNRILDRFAATLEQREDVPEWLRERTQHMRQWRSQARLASVILFWRDNRFDGDETLFSEMNAWRRKDKHLYQWQTKSVAKTIRKRSEVFNNFVAKLSREYRIAKIEDTNWRELSKKPMPEEEDMLRTRYAMRLAAPGLLLQRMKGRMADTVTCSAVNTTQRCSACGELATFDADKNLRNRCAHCGAEWDQDWNAAVNLLKSEAVTAE